MLLAHAVAIATTLITIAGLFYFLLALWATRAYSHSRRAPAPSAYPSVSILKPVKGVDAGMYKAFASHCQQEYSGDYEIIFGVRSMQDDVVALIQRLQTEFPDCKIRLLICPDTLGPNGKIGTLMQMLPQARFDHLLINDGDIRVSAKYLCNVMRRFSSGSNPSTKKSSRAVGMVTALYRGRSHGTLGSKLEALGIATDFMPGVLMARWIEKGIHFGMGSTLAMSRTALDAIGGLAPVLEYLGDDYELGKRISRAGFRVVLAREVVETSIPAYRFRQFVDHQLRWARNLRDARKAGYWGMLITYGLPWAFINVITNGASLPSLALLSLTLAARVALALSVGVGVLNDGQVLRDLWLLPLRDFVALGIWCWSFADDHIIWRGERFLLRNGKLTKIQRHASL